MFDAICFHVIPQRLIGPLDFDCIAAGVACNQLRRAAVDQNAAMIDDHQTIAEPRGLLHVMGGHQNRQAGGFQRRQFVPHLVAGLRVDNLTNGTDSGWVQGAVNWTSLGLNPNTQYSFATRTRNGDGIENPIGPGAAVYTLAMLPTAAPFGGTTQQSVLVRWDANGNPPGTEYLVDNITLGTSSGWITALEWLDTSTGPNSTYSYLVRARNGDGVETGTTFVGTVETGFFGDGFESADTTAWSSTTP